MSDEDTAFEAAVKMTPPPKEPQTIWSDGHGLSFHEDGYYVRIDVKVAGLIRDYKIRPGEARALGVALLKATTTGTLINLLDEAWGDDD